MSFFIYRFSILLDMKLGMRISAIHPILSDDPCSFSNRIFLFSSVSVFESVTYRHMHTRIPEEVLLNKSAYCSGKIS